MTEPANSDRKQSGKFQPGQSGNPAGKPKGTRHAATLAAEALLDGEARSLTRKAVDLALAGDTVALRLCLERILPARKSMPVRIDLPKMEKAADIVNVQAALMQAAGAGEITPDEAATLGSLAENTRKALETQQFEQRLTALEKSLNNTGGEA